MWAGTIASGGSRLPMATPVRRHKKMGNIVIPIGWHRKVTTWIASAHLVIAILKVTDVHPPEPAMKTVSVRLAIASGRLMMATQVRVSVNTKDKMVLRVIQVCWHCKVTP